MKPKSQSRKRGASSRRPTGPRGHRLPAHVTGEDDWDVEVPQIRMSRAFAVMLLLHLVAVGGLIAFHMYGKDDQEEGREAATAKSSAAASSRAAGIEELAAPRAEVIPEGEPGEHVVARGETRNLIAARYGVSVAELNEANPGVDFVPGATLVIPQHQRVISAPPIAPREDAREVDLFSPQDDSVREKAFAVKEQANPRPATEVARGTQSASPARRNAPPKPVPALPSSSDDNAPRAIPVAEPAPKAVPVDTSARRPAAGSRTHVIGKGDTLYGIARRYRLSRSAIAEANGISESAVLQIGTVLTIPQP